MIRILFICIFLSGNAIAENHEIEPFINEVQKYKFSDFKALSENELKKALSYFGQSPTHYEEKELRAKAKEMIEQSTAVSNDQSLSAEERAIGSAGASLKSSFARKTKYSNIDQEIWMKKSQLVTENPLIGLDSDCAVSAEVNDKVEVKYEPYEVEVDSIREVESEETCEEDGTEIHKCYETLNVQVDKQENCDAGTIKYLSVDTGLYWYSRWYWSYKYTGENGGLAASWSYGYPKLSINIYKIGGLRKGDAFGHKLNFQIDDLSMVQSFVLTGYNANFSITLNGHTLQSALMDLKPFLKTGVNIIYSVAPATWGLNANIIIEAKQYCFKEVETWTNDCGGL